MKRIKKLGALLVAAAMSLTLISGCTNSNTTNPTTAPAADVTTADGTAAATTKASTGAVDFYIFNTKGENADALQAAVDAYSAETGQNIKVFSLGAGTNSSDALNTEMNSANMPTIFSIMNLQELKGWVEGGFALDLSQAADPDFKAMTEAIPSNLYLTNDSVTNYGIPYNVEGYGYVVDTLMLADLFGADSVDAILADIKTATYAEWEAFVLALDAYIQSATAGSVTLSGNSYAFAAEKGALASSLTGVFATAGSQTWTYGDHFLNVAIDAVFADASAAASATPEQLDALKGPLLAYAKALDLKTSHAAGTDAALPRGPEFINTTTASYDASVQLLADHKAVFLKQGNWVYGNIEKVNAEIVKTLTFLPVKMPFTAEDIKTEGLTVEKMSQSIPVFVPNYYAINAKSTADEQLKAEAFLVWLNTSDAGKKFVVEDMAFIPYNADPATTTLPNSLGQSILEYLATGDTITNAYAGAPTNWAGATVGLKVMESYLNKETWTEADYEDIANYAIEQWKTMAAS